MTIKSRPSYYHTIWLFIVGLIIGLFIVGFATLIALSTTGQSLTLENMIGIHFNTPLLWVIDASALFLVVILAILGSREDQLDRVRRMGGIAQKRAADLLRINAQMSRKDQEHQELEAIISRGKKEWEATFDSVEDMILITDEDGIINRCNRATTSTFQKDFLQIIGKQADDLFFGESTEEKDRLPYQKMEMRFPTLDGWFEVSSNRLVSEGTQLGRIFIISNVTERKKASLDLQRQKQFYEALVMNNPIAIVTLDMNQRVVASNPAFEELFGYDQSEMLGQELDNLISPTELIEETQSLTESVREGDVVYKITQRLHKDGSLLDVELFGIPVVLWGKQVGIFGLYHDVSELVRTKMDVMAVPADTEQIVGAELEEDLGLMELEEWALVDEAVAIETESELLEEGSLEEAPLEEALEALPVEEEVPLSEEPKKRPVSVETIEGVGPKYAQQLAEVGIVSTDDLLEVAGDRKGRQDLVDNTGISGKLILKWVNRADLMRVPGVGEEYSDLLEAAGVDTVKELRNRNPEHLYQALLAINEQKNLVRRAPHQSEVEAWIQAAEEIDPLLTY